MGFISRKILSACANTCVCCPALRSRSRKPVKRYKKVLAEIFPKSLASVYPLWICIYLLFLLRRKVVLFGTASSAYQGYVGSMMQVDNVQYGIIESLRYAKMVIL